MINDTKDKIAKFLFIGKEFDELKKYDLVIVFGNNLYEETAIVLYNLFQKKKIDKNTTIIISGNKGIKNQDITSTEAEIIYNYFAKYNLDIPCILEKNATNTKENLIFSKKLLKDLNNYQNILFVCKSYLARRALMTADKLNFPLNKIDIYGVESEFGKNNWYTSPQATKRVLEELERISKYTISNDLKL